MQISQLALLWLLFKTTLTLSAETNPQLSLTTKTRPARINVKMTLGEKYGVHTLKDEYFVKNYERLNKLPWDSVSLL